MNDKINVLLLGPSPKIPGGVSTCVSNYLNSKNFNSFNIIYFKTGTGGKGTKLFDNLIVVMKENIFQLIKFIIKIKSENYKIVHIHTPSWAGFWRFSIYVFLLKIINIDCILHIHGAEFKKFYSSSNIINKKLISATLEGVTCLFVLSQMWKEYYNSIAPKVKKEIIVNTVKLPKQYNKRNNSIESINILFLGALVRRKGLIELMNIIPKLLQNTSNVNVQVVGFPVQQELDIYTKLKELSNNKDLSDRFVLKTNVSENSKEKFYENADIFILQSSDEGLPFTLLEAMSYSLPVITTPVGAIPEVIINKENGILINPKDEIELYKNIRYLINNKQIRQTMGKRNRNIIQNQYTHEIMFKKTIKIYEEIIKSY